MEELTRQEADAIAALKRLASRWPKTLWLFSASGDLHVMRFKNGKRATIVQDGSEGMDPSYIADTIQGIVNDGGDW